MATEPRGCLASLFGMGGGTRHAGSANQTARQVTLPYERTERLLSAAEYSFLGALRLAVANKYDIFPKVRLLDVVNVKAGAGRQAAFNRVQSKHLDFLLCDRDTSRPILAIELDDSTHQRAERKVRDAFLEEVLEVVGLPAVRFPVTRAYDPHEIARLITSSISGDAASNTPS